MSAPLILLLAILCVGILASIVGAIWYVVRGFQESLLWGFLNLLVPFATLFFTFMKWDRAKAPFLCTLVGGLLLMGTAMTAGSKGTWQNRALSEMMLPGFGETMRLDLGSANSAPAAKPSDDVARDLELLQMEMITLEQSVKSETEELAKSYNTLTARRKALVPGDQEAVREYNKEAAAYKERNTALTARKHQLEEMNQRQETLFAKQIGLAATAANSGAGGVVIYSTSWCGPCKSAKAYLKSKGIPFEDRDVEKSPAFRKEFEAHGGNGVPLLVIKGRKIRGFSPDEIDKALAGK